jgi:peptide/nickel transport system permease protein
VGKYWGGKALQYALVLAITLTLNFFLPRMMPGTPLQYLAGEDVGLLSPQAKAKIIADHGLDRPLGQQFLTYLGKLAKGDLGYSFQQKRPISTIIRERLSWTLLLTGISLLLATLVGIAAGTVAAWCRGTKIDVGLLGIFVFLESLPSFWLGMILVAVFSGQLRLLPAFGAVTPWGGLSGWAYVRDVAWHLVLPAATLTIITTPGTFMTMRYSMLQVLGEDYILMAKAKGLSNAAVMFRHAMRNALLPVATVFLLNLGFIVGGATVIETVFSYPGVGRLMYEAVMNRDYPVLQATFLIVTVSVVLANLLADLVYPWLDPRVRRVASAS